MKKLSTALLLCLALIFSAESIPAQPLPLRLNDTTLSDTFSVRRGFRMSRSPVRKNIAKRNEKQDEKNQSQQAQQNNPRSGFFGGLFAGTLLGSLFGSDGGFGLILVLLLIGGLWLYFRNKSNV